MDRRNDRARLGHDHPALTGGAFLFVLALDDVYCRSDTRVVPVIGCDHVDAPELSPSLMHEFDMGALLEPSRRGDRMRLRVAALASVSTLGVWQVVTSLDYS